MTLFRKNIKSLEPIKLGSRVSVVRSLSSDKSFPRKCNNKPGEVVGFVKDKILGKSKEDILIRVLIDETKEEHDFWVEEVHILLF